MAKKARVKNSELEELVDAFESSYMFEQPWPETVDIEGGYIRVHYDRIQRIAPLTTNDFFTSFAKLAAHGEPSEKKIERWVGRFGLPMWGNRPDQEGAGSKDAMRGNMPLSMAVNDFRTETKVAHDLLLLYSLIRGRNAAEIKVKIRNIRAHADDAPALDCEFLEKFMANKATLLGTTNEQRAVSCRDTYLSDKSGPGTSTGAMVRLRQFDSMITLLAAQSALGEIVTRLILNVRPRVGIQRGQGLVPSYECPDLPSAIYLQFYLLVTKNKVPRFCKNPTCGELFFPERKDQLYCPGDSCRSNAYYHRKL